MRRHGLWGLGCGYLCLFSRVWVIKCSYSQGVRSCKLAPQV